MVAFDDARNRFTDEVSEEDAERVASAAQARCVEMEPFALTLGPARVTSEGVVLDVAPAEHVHELREVLRTAIADVWSAERVLEAGKEFVPHVSFAYNTAAPAAPLVELSRDVRVYRWDVVTTVGLRGG